MLAIAKPPKSSRPGLGNHKRRASKRLPTDISIVELGLILCALAHIGGVILLRCLDRWGIARGDCHVASELAPRNDKKRDKLQLKNLRNCSDDCGSGGNRVRPHSGKLKLRCDSGPDPRENQANLY